MKNRPPYNVTFIVRLYNIFQVCACIYFVIKFQNFGYSFKYTWKCAVGEVPISEGMIITGFLYLLLRLVEFIETVFFTLRKKQNQVSVLHIYHHISTVAVFWLFFKYSFGKFSIYLATINLNYLLSFRCDGNGHGSLKYLCAHHHVQLLLLELFQANAKVHKSRETIFNSDSNHSTFCDSWTVRCCRNAELQGLKNFLCSVDSDCHSDFLIFAVLF